jgi:integrase
MAPNRTAEASSLPIHDWPDLDRTLWSAAKQPVGLFDAPHRGADWAPNSWRKAERGYGRWLRWISTTHPDLLALPAPQRVTKLTLAAWRAHLELTLAPMSCLSLMEDLLRAITILAPDTVPDALKRMHAYLRATARPSRNKRQRLVSAADLVALGEELMAEAEAHLDWSARRRAVTFRDGLAISLLAFRPFRISNFGALLLGADIVQLAGSWHLVLARDSTKNNRPHEAVFPDHLVDNLGQYLAIHRPILLQGEACCIPSDSDALWISETGSALQPDSLSRRIANLTEGRLGRRIPPHWFRDAAATTIAIETPRQIGDAHLILGHASPLTTEKHYIQARSIEAGAKFQAAMLERLGSLVSTSSKETF